MRFYKSVKSGLREEKLDGESVCFSGYASR